MESSPTQRIHSIPETPVRAVVDATIRSLRIAEGFDADSLEGMQFDVEVVDLWGGIGDPTRVPGMGSRGTDSRDRHGSSLDGGGHLQGRG